MTVPVFLAESPGPDGDDSAAIGPGDEIVLAGAEGRHAATVRRLRAGERVDVTDGMGRVAECVVRDVLKDALRLTVLKRYEVPPPSPRVIVAQGLPKGDRGELAVEMMTEAGVDVIVPWAASRCVTQWRGDRGARALARWRATAREAAKQARRFHLPEITEPYSTDRLADLLTGAARAIVLHEEATEPLSRLALPSAGDVSDIVVVVGPEGGVTGEELDRFRAVGAVPARLGPTVLRTSTAGVAATAVLMTGSGRW
ncbi:MAG TPA: 16S rRNA (uracil(1498)-N(3))-methyltransferase [Thermopolyspora sp.]